MRLLHLGFAGAHHHIPSTTPPHQNVLLSNYGSDVEIFITDFGLAKRDATCKTFCGTPAYFAPEVLQRQDTVAGQGNYGKEADLWSVGVLTYVVLSGSPAFPSDSSIAAGRFTPMTGRRWESVSPEAKAFVAALIEVNPMMRLTATQALGHPWLAPQAHEEEGTSQVPAKRQRSDGGS